MNTFKTIDTLKKYKTLIETANPDKITSDDKFFVCNIELELAKSLLQDFSKETISKLGQILSTEVGKSDEYNYIPYYSYSCPFSKN